jgi:hypothetical protein
MLLINATRERGGPTLGAPHGGGARGLSRHGMWRGRGRAPASVARGSGRAGSGGAVREAGEWGREALTGGAVAQCRVAQQLTRGSGWHGARI